MISVGTEKKFGTLNPNAAYPYMDAAAEIRKHEKLIRYLANKYVTSGVELDDLMQEGRIALLACLETFEGRNGAELWTYAKDFVRSAMLKFLTREIAEAARPTGAAGEDDRTMSQIEDSTPNAEADILQLEIDISDTTRLALARQAFEALLEREREIIRLHLEQGESFRRIAGLLGLSKSDADRSYRSALERLREAAA